MKKVANGIAISLMLFILGTPVSDAKSLEKDWETMDKLLTEGEAFLYQSEFEKHPDAFVDQWLEFSEEFSEKLNTFKAEYGSDRNTLTDAFKDVDKPDNVKRESYQIINELLNADMDQLQERIHGWAEAMGEENVRKLDYMKEPDPTKVELKLKYLNNALTAYRVAGRLDPDADYSKIIDRCEAMQKETEKQYTETLKELKWPGHNPNFSGPGNPEKLADAALEFLRDHPGWSKPEYDDEHTPYAACVTGSGWEVSKKAPLTGVPTQFSLDITVAFTGNRDSDIVYVYSMVFYTAEETGVKKELPFKYANSRQYAKYTMLKKNVPEGASSAKSSAGGSFGFWRLIFSLLLILGGMIGAKSMIITRLPSMKSFIDKLSALIMPIGLLLVLMGLLGFLGNIVRLVPLASLLPQATGILLGLVFLKKKPGPIPPAYLEKIPLPGTLTMPLGIGALILGLMHLLFGGFPLF